MDWRHHAACRDEDPELFFPTGNAGPALSQIAEAKTVCRRCSVAGECLSWALQAGEAFGVWGGLSEVERRAMKETRRRVDYGLARTRECKLCHQHKKLTEFGRDKQTSDGISWRCKLCRRLAARSRRYSTQVV